MPRLSLRMTATSTRRTCSNRSGEMLGRRHFFFSQHVGHLCCDRPVNMSYLVHVMSRWLQVTSHPCQYVLFGVHMRMSLYSSDDVDADEV
jgi:hypothetical protein